MLLVKLGDSFTSVWNDIAKDSLQSHYNYLCWLVLLPFQAIAKRLTLKENSHQANLDL